jgi:CheY-like chemotaxis protein
MTHEMLRETILVVDDNRDIRGLIRICLEKAGYTVHTVADGEEGLRFYREHQSSIVLILTDVAMPNMNGHELADRVLRIDSQMPVLLMSGDVWTGYRGLECIAKPVAPAELIAKVGRMLKDGCANAGEVLRNPHPDVR